MAVFGLFFGLHIVFAARDMGNAFAAVAALITLQVVTFGPLTARMSASKTASERRLVLRRSFPVALALAVGLAWAYGGMAGQPLRWWVCSSLTGGSRPCRPTLVLLRPSFSIVGGLK